MKTDPLFRLPFHDYHPEIRDGLRSLVERFPAQVVADAAQTLADNIEQYAADHGASEVSL